MTADTHRHSVAVPSHFYFWTSVNKETARAYRLEKLQNNFLKKALWWNASRQNGELISAAGPWKEPSKLAAELGFRAEWMVIKPPEVSEHDAVTAGCPHTIPPLAEGSRGQKERVEPATLVRGAVERWWWRAWSVFKSTCQWGEPIYTNSGINMNNTTNPEDREHFSDRAYQRFISKVQVKENDISYFLLYYHCHCWTHNHVNLFITKLHWNTKLSSIVLVIPRCTF